MTYKITVTTPTERITYSAIGDRNALMDAAYERFGVCGLTVIAQ